MSFPTFNTKSPTIKRILKEASELSSHPDPTLHASPLESDLFEWHFTLAGPPSTPYSEGIYHGRITLPPSYPLRPPSFRFLTPSGRFEVNREICLSISGHHEETWQPAWGIRTALWALRAFMEGGAKGQVGGMEMGKDERMRLARESRRWRCAGCGGRTGEDILREEAEKIEMEGGRGGKNKPEGAQDVPKELRIGFKDEMGKGKEKEEDISSSSLSDHPQIPSIPNSTIPMSSSSTNSQTLHQTSNPNSTNLLQSSSIYSSSHPSPTTTAATTSQTTNPRLPPSPNHVPAWIDTAIAGLVASLVIMIIKKFVV
jgi:ubiquitin-conjugating enzyme E2 J1